MPPADDILAGVSMTAARWWPLALAWHLSLGLLLFAAWRGWRPAPRTIGRLLALPMASVGALAWHSGNPFNGAVFLSLAAWLGWYATRLPADVVWPGSRRSRWAGGALVAFGWAYPHFLGPLSWRYLIAAPLGLIPCPTLSAAIGILLLLNLRQARVLDTTMAIVGVVYGLFGIARLGVTIDVVLLAGALVLLTTAMTARPSAQPVPGVWKEAA